MWRSPGEAGPHTLLLSEQLWLDRASGNLAFGSPLLQATSPTSRDPGVLLPSPSPRAFGFIFFFKLTFNLKSPVRGGGRKAIGRSALY